MSYYLQIPAVVIPLDDNELDIETSRKIYALLKDDDWVILGREGQGPICQYTVMSRKENGEPKEIMYMNHKDMGILNN